jgi:serine/threonine protein kinase
MEHAVMCPQCNAPLAPHKFDQSVVCSYCGSTVQLDKSTVSANVFHSAFRLWNSPKSYQISSWLSVAQSHWELDECIATGDISDVYTGKRARWPTELAIIKILREQQDLATFDNEWDILQTLQRSDARGSDIFTMLLPQPILHGTISDGSYTGQHVKIFRWASGFRHTFDDVLRAHPQGIQPRASIWIWRRILEVLSFIHNSGLVHGAVLPSHLLVQENEHGIRLVGYGTAGQLGKKLPTISQNYRSFYPNPAQSGSCLTPQMDIAMSARCIIAILGGDPATGSLPTSVPPRLARLIRQIALQESTGLTSEDAWSIREELGVIAGEVFGPPQFIPIVMPS